MGKTSLVHRYVEGRFDDKYLSTIGVKISRKSIEFDNHQVNLIIWDLAGGEDFADVHDSYLSGARGALIVCDLTRSNTLHHLSEYTQQFITLNPSAHVVYLGNKNDLENEREITEDELRSICRQLHGPYLLTSAKTGEMVENAMLLLVESIEKNH